MLAAKLAQSSVLGLKGAVVGLMGWGVALLGNFAQTGVPGMVGIGDALTGIIAVAVTTSLAMSYKQGLKLAAIEVALTTLAALRVDVDEVRMDYYQHDAQIKEKWDQQDDCNGRVDDELKDVQAKVLTSQQSLNTCQYKHGAHE